MVSGVDEVVTVVVEGGVVGWKIVPRYGRVTRVGESTDLGELLWKYAGMGEY